MREHRTEKALNNVYTFESVNISTCKVGSKQVVRNYSSVFPSRSAIYGDHFAKVSLMYKSAKKHHRTSRLNIFQCGRMQSKTSKHVYSTYITVLFTVKFGRACSVHN